MHNIFYFVILVASLFVASCLLFVFAPSPKKMLKFRVNLPFVLSTGTKKNSSPCLFQLCVFVQNHLMNGLRYNVGMPKRCMMIFSAGIFRSSLLWIFSFSISLYMMFVVASLFFGFSKNGWSIEIVIIQVVIATSVSWTRSHRYIIWRLIVLVKGSRSAFRSPDGHA